MRIVCCIVIFVGLIVDRQVLHAQGPVLWLKADTGTVFHNNRVVIWKDISGNNNDIAADSAHAPFFIPSAINSRASVGFRGNEWMHGPSVFPVKRSYTVCVVVKIDDGYPNNLVSGNDHAIWTNWTYRPVVVHSNFSHSQVSKVDMWPTTFNVLIASYDEFDQQASCIVNGQFADSTFVGPNLDS